MKFSGDAIKRLPMGDTEKEQKRDEQHRTIWRKQLP